MRKLRKRLNSKESYTNYFTQYLGCSRMLYHKNKTILNPNTGTTVFGVVPEVLNSRYHFPEGDIFLRYGEHRGPNRGWGLRHLWVEHEKQLGLMGYESEEDSARYVADILQPGAKIYCEFASLRNEKMAVLQSTLGTVIIEHRYDENNKTFYSVVTAFGSKRPHGQLIGNLK